jgi:hypothetical protein
MQENAGFDYLQPGPSKPFKSPTKVASCKRKIKCSDNKADKAYNIIESLWQNKMNKESRDEYTSFGEVVASKIRKLPTAYERCLVQQKINTLLFEAEMGQFSSVSNKCSASSTAESPISFMTDNAYSVAHSPSSLISQTSDASLRSDIHLPISDFYESRGT